MRLYVLEYGLTELRFYTLAFMVWLAGVLAWLVVTVLRRDPSGRRRFAYGAVLGALVALLALNLINPDALIARTNLARAATGAGQPLDTTYLGRNLSADAVPEVLAGLPAVRDTCARADLARALREKTTTLADDVARRDWRGANWDESAALAALNASFAGLTNDATACPPRQESAAP